MKPIQPLDSGVRCLKPPEKKKKKHLPIVQVPQNSLWCKKYVFKPAQASKCYLLKI